MKASLSARKRFLIALPLGIFFGFICAALAASSAPTPFWWWPIMWSIVTDRFLIGVLIAMAGAYTIHPVFGFACPWFLRGAVMGIIWSLPLATGAMSGSNPFMSPWSLFLATILAGIMYGIIIDFCATKWGGEGKDLVK